MTLPVFELPNVESADSSIEAESSGIKELEELTTLSDLDGILEKVTSPYKSG